MELGTRAWEVEWCSDLPVNEYGDCEPDLATYKVRILKTKAAAIRVAKQAAKQSACGDARLCEVELTDPFGDRIRRTYIWEAVGDPEYIEATEAVR